MKNLSIKQQIVFGDVLIDLTNKIKKSESYVITVNLYEYVKTVAEKNNINFNYLEDILDIMDNIIEIFKINFVVKYKLDNFGNETNTIIIKDVNRVRV